MDTIQQLHHPATPIHHDHERRTVMIDTGIGRLLELTDSDAAGFPPAFFEWLAENQSIYRGFVLIAREGHRRGLRKWSAKAIFEVLRWQTATREVDSKFKLNNNHTSKLARLAMKQFPELSGVFAIRELRTK